VLAGGEFVEDGLIPYNVHEAILSFVAPLSEKKPEQRLTNKKQIRKSRQDFLRTELVVFSFICIYEKHWQ
jgi:hypothetical protein